MFKRKGTFFIVLLFTLLISYVSIFGLDISYYHIMGAQDMRLGIDIRGGVDAAFAPKDLGRAPTADEMERARTIIETRLDDRNILDRDVTIDKENGYVFVRFPWKTGETDFDPETAIAELGSMAHLTFVDPDGNVVLEGKHVETSSWGRDTTKAQSQFVVMLKLKPEGRALFAEATARLVGQNIAIYMDDTLISNPNVTQAIDSEECEITNITSAAEAERLSEQINAGALPFALITQNYSAISPLLGNNALDVMVMAGILAFALICLGLILRYRLSGFVASIALLLQVAGQLVLLTWPQFTVTLPGIAGIILSIGMGVDANIIIAERIREELRTGKGVRAAVASGFKRAFSSVFDGNITVLIVAFIMMIFGSGAMLSFAYTLLFGIIMNFLAGVLATRLMTMSLVQFEVFRKPAFFMGAKSLAKTETKVYPFYKKRKNFFIVSGAIMLLGVVMIFVNGVHLDIQFKGGSILKYSMSESIELNADDAANVAQDALTDRLVTAQITTDYATQEKKLVLSTAGGESLSSDELTGITAALREAYPEQAFEISETNNVAPFFGRRFLQNGIIAIALSALLIIVYVWFSFRKIHGLSAGAMALLSLLHDILVVFFAFVIFRIPIGDSFIAVALTILGYSINDTIVIYDRVRENAKLDKHISTEALIDKSISQSFTRSLFTNLAVFLSVALVYGFAAGNGLDSIRSFALPMAIGTISGCYSTVCIAGPIWAMWQNRNTKKAKKLRRK